MAIIKCKMCGGDLNVAGDSQIAVCEYCGTQQTVPKQDNEKKLTLFARANRLRFSCEFDKAAGVYESIVAEFPEEPEAYWGLVLCKYGIEYVDDPATGKKVPTCHRSSFDSVLEDANFELVMEYSDVVTRKIYREEAKAIEELRRGIIEVSSREEPYDIFICYKETDENGQRTLDSVLAQDLYDALTEKGYRVFFSRITLEDKLGQEYEPYIFAALNSARVMLAVGTDYEYYNAPWVKNEWSRYLQLIAAGQKKSLIPCYKNIDAHDMPKEFAKLQAQDLGKIGATQDLLRGIDKLLGRTAAPAPAPQPQTADPKAPLLKRAGMYLADGDFASARQYANRVLDLDPEEPHAYMYLLLAELKIRTVNEEALVSAPRPLETYPDYCKACRFAAGSYKQTLDELRMKQKKLLYTRAVSDQPMAESENDMIALAARFDALGDYVDSKSRSSALMLKVSSLREERKKKQQEEQRRQEEAAARKQQEQADREEQARQRAEQHTAIRPAAAERRLNERHDDDGRVRHERHGRGLHGFQCRELRRHDAKIDAAHGKTAQQRAPVDLQQPPEQRRQKCKRQQKPHRQQREFAHVLQADFCKHIRCAARNDDRRQQQLRLRARHGPGLHPYSSRKCLDETIPRLYHCVKRQCFNGSLRNLQGRRQLMEPLKHCLFTQ